ncbi:MAG: segregation and condensation protein B [Methyloligella sp.]|nr:MAG: segregation and condensation protein B [Methyloligella sp.]
MSDEQALDHERLDDLRILEALIFVSPDPLSVQALSEELDEGVDVSALLEQLKSDYSNRGIQLVSLDGKWAFRTATDLAPFLTKYKVVKKKLTKVAQETLAIIAYHQPVTRAEIEDVRGVQTSSGTLDVLLETGWIKMRGRRRAPGRPITYGTTDLFLDQFGLGAVDDLPGLRELKGAGLLDGTLPANFEVPSSQRLETLMDDEVPLDEDIDEDVDHKVDNEGDGGGF